MATTKILILESNPRGDLNLNQEIRDLQDVIDRVKSPEQFEVKQGLATRPGDLQELMLKHEPQIVHFCGHGTGERGLVFQDDRQQEQIVDTAALSNLFRLCGDKLRCVLLNACYSEVQAQAIVQHIDYVIGMKQEIRDDAARHFAQGFYLSLAYGRSVEVAYEFGCNAIQLMLSNEAAKRSGVTERQLTFAAVQATEIPEYLKPVLLVRARGSQVVGSEKGVKPTVEELQVLNQVLNEEDARQDVRSQYRARVRECLVQRKLEGYQRIVLNRFRQELGLAVAEAAAILAEELAPIEEAQAAYGQLLQDFIDGGYYPLSDEVRAELQKLQDRKGLTAGEVAAISAPILAAAEREWLEKERLDKERKEGQVFRFEIVLVDPQGQVWKRETQEARQQVDNLPNGVNLERVFVPGGFFLMGAAAGEAGVYDDERPQHLVTVQSFFMGKYPVTQAQWRSVASLPPIQRELQPNPAHFKGDRRPVEKVSWWEAVEFCDRLSGHTGKEYRLPSEAEWEYACRAKTTTPFYFGETITTDLANYYGTDDPEGRWSGSYGQGPKGQYRQATTDVGSFPPNGFGLYDMHGNVWEWCEDGWHGNYEGAPTDGSMWSDGNTKLLRGGSWNGDPRDCRAACRFNNFPDTQYSNIGFRVVCVAARTP